MELIGNDIFLFRNCLTDSLHKRLYAMFDGVPINRDQFKKDVDTALVKDLNALISKKVEAPIHEYLLDLKIESRPDLLDYSGCFNTDLEYYEKHKEFRNSLRDSNPIQIENASARELHRGNIVYFGNFVEWKGFLNKFGIFINVSNPGETDTSIQFPIQKQEITLSYRDIIVSPAGITHPFLINIMNGKLKFIECL